MQQSFAPPVHGRKACPLEEGSFHKPCGRARRSIHTVPRRHLFGARGTTCLLPPAAAQLAVTEAPLAVAAQCFGDPDLGPATAAYGTDGLLSLSFELVHRRGEFGNGGVQSEFRLWFNGLVPPSRIERESTV